MKKWMKIAALLFFTLPIAVQAQTITDDFTVASNWGKPLTFGGSISVGSGRMNYTAATTKNVGAGIPRKTPLLPFTRDWSLQVDAHLSSLNLTTNDEDHFSDVFLGVGKTGDWINNHVTFEFGQGYWGNPDKIGYYVQDDARTNGVDVSNEIDLFETWITSSDVSLRMDYCATNHTVTYYLDANGASGGYNWVAQGTASLVSGTYNLNLSDTDTFTVFLLGSSASNAITAGQAYLDNLVITVQPVATGTLTIVTNGPGTVTRLPAGVPEIGKGYTLTAVPAKTGSAFSGWSGDATGTNKVLSFTMTSNMTITANFTDTLKPTVAITAPTAKLRILGTNPVYTVKGTATDNGVMTGVFCRVNGEVWTNAATTNGWKNWSVPMTLTAGSNLVQAFSADSSGNLSLIAGVSCTYVVTGTLTIQTNGVGTVTRAPVGLPEVGKIYTLTAAAKTGYSFSNWSGDATGTNKVLSFTMTNNVAIAANFIDTAKPTVTITLPKDKLRITNTNPVYMVKGTAADNGAVATVNVQLNGGDWTNAVTTNAWKNWSLPVTLVTGTNTVRAYSVDTTGNNSSTSIVVCTYPVVTIDVAAYANLSVGGRWNYKQTEGTDISTRALEVIEITVKNSNTVYLLQEYTDWGTPDDQFFWLADFSEGLFDTGGLNDNGQPTQSIFYWKPFMPKLPKTFVPETDITIKCARSDMTGFVTGKGKIVRERVIVPAGTYDCWKVTGTATFNGQVSSDTSWYAENVGLVKRLQDGSLWELTSYVPPAVSSALADVSSEAQSSSIANAASANSTLAPVPTAQATIVVDGLVKDWANVPRSSFSYASVTQEVAVALDGNSIALLLNGCPFGASDNVLVYFKLRLSYGVGDDRHSVDLWTSGSVLYGMVDGKVITGLEAVLLNGVLEVKLPVEQAPSQVTIEEIGCGMDLGGGTVTELFKLTPPTAFFQ